MSIVCVRSFAVSLDGFAAGLDQRLDQPLGARGPELMEWFFNTRVWRDMHGLGGGETGVDNRMAEPGFQNIGAWILGGTCSGPSGDRGQTRAGGGGGATSRPTTSRRSS